MSSLVARAALVAALAHRGQADKLGDPYMGHVRRVAARVESDDEKVVAYLHDVVEDTDLTAGDLLVLGFPEYLVEAVVVLTHRRNEPRVEYYARVKANSLARRVKLADVADNSDPARLALLDDQLRGRLEMKYAAAELALTGD